MNHVINTGVNRSISLYDCIIFSICQKRNVQVPQKRLNALRTETLVYDFVCISVTLYISLPKEHAFGLVGR